MTDFWNGKTNDVNQLGKWVQDKLDSGWEILSIQVAGNGTGIYAWAFMTKEDQ
jgi:hypothetical protein